MLWTQTKKQEENTMNFSQKAIDDICEHLCNNPLYNKLSDIEKELYQRNHSYESFYKGMKRLITGLPITSSFILYAWVQYNW